MQTDSFHIFQKQLGARMQGVRKARGLSQEAAGTMVGMDRVSIGYIEQGKRAPKLSTLYALAQAYEVSVGSFFDFEDAGE